MEMFLKIIDMLFKRYRWLGWLCGAIILITSFYCPNTYKKAGDRLISKVINTAVQEGNEIARMVGWILNKWLDNMMKSINNKK